MPSFLIALQIPEVVPPEVDPGSGDPGRLWLSCAEASFLAAAGTANARILAEIKQFLHIGQIVKQETGKFILVSMKLRYNRNKW